MKMDRIVGSGRSACAVVRQYPDDHRAQSGRMLRMIRQESNAAEYRALWRLRPSTFDPRVISEPKSRRRTSSPDEELVEGISTRSTGDGVSCYFINSSIADDEHHRGIGEAGQAERRDWRRYNLVNRRRRYKPHDYLREDSGGWRKSGGAEAVGFHGKKKKNRFKALQNGQDRYGASMPTKARKAPRCDLSEKSKKGNMFNLNSRQGPAES